MPGDNDITTGQVQRNYESLPTQPKAPVKPDIQKTALVEKKVLGNEEKRTETQAQFIARKAIGAYERNEASRQPPPSLFTKLVSLVVNYLKAKFSPKPAEAVNVEVSRPFNVRGSTLEKRLERQMAIVDFNMRNPEAKPIPLDKDLPQTYAALREALKEIDDRKVSLPFNIDKHGTAFQTHLKAARKQLELLKENLRPGGKQHQLDPKYPMDLINLNELIQALELKTSHEDLINGPETDEWNQNIQKEDRSEGELLEYSNNPINGMKPTSTWPSENNPLAQFKEDVQALRDKITNSSLNSVKKLTDQIDYLEGLKTEAFLNNKDTSRIQNAIDLLAGRKNSLLEPQVSIQEMKKVREEELANFESAIDWDESRIAAIMPELEALESELNTVGWQEGVSILHDYHALTEEKERLEQQVAGNKNTRRDIMEELGILNAKSPSIRELKDLDLERPLQDPTEEDWEQGVAEAVPNSSADRVADLKFEIYNLESQIDEAMSLGDFNQAADLALEKEELEASLEGMKDHTSDIHELSEMIRIQRDELEKINQQMANLNAEIKNPALPTAFGENMVKMKEFRTQRNALMAELKKNEDELNSIL